MKRLRPEPEIQAHPTMYQVQAYKQNECMRKEPHKRSMGMLSSTDPKKLDFEKNVKSLKEKLGTTWRHVMVFDEMWQIEEQFGP